MKKKEKQLLLIGAALAGGYWLYTKTKAQPVQVAAQPQAQPAGGGLVDAIGNLLGGLAKGWTEKGKKKEETVKLGPPDIQNVPVPGTHLPGYGGLSGSSIGGCSTLGCADYGSLG